MMQEPPSPTLLAPGALAGFGVQDLPSREAVRETTHRILSSEEFQFGPDTSTGLWQWIVDKVRSFFEALARLQDTSPVLAWVIVAACAVLLALIALHMFVVLRRAMRAAKAPSGGPEAPTKRERAAALLERARAAAKAGDAAAALTLYLRASIAGLDQRGLQRAIETATAREYLSLLRRHPEERSLFEQLLAYYEPGVFGRRALGPGPMDDCDRIARRIAGEVA